MNKFLLNPLIILFVSTAPFIANGQTLTISSAANSASGWSISGNTLTVTANSNIQASVIENHLTNTGSLSIVGNSSTFNVIMSQAISVASGNNALTIGSSDNSNDDITISSSLSIRGSLNIYGKNITINNNITSIGNILFRANIDITISKAVAINSNGGNLILWSNALGNNVGDVFFGADLNTSYTNPASINTNGGHLWIGGGSGTTTWNGLTVGDSYSVGNTGRPVGGSFTHYNGIMIQATSISTSGGHIKMSGMGKAGTYNHPSYSGGIYIVGGGTMNSNGGNIEIEALAQSGSNGNYGLYNLGTYLFAPGSGDLTIFGDASSSSSSFSSNAVGNGILLWSGAISSTGNIKLIGKRSTGAGTFGIYINDNIVTTGTNKNITLETDNLYINSVKTITSTGQLIVKPFNPASTIGIGGASGTLQLPASYFSSNFTDGFSNIQIGSDSQSGNIIVNTFTLRDNMTLLTSGSLTLGGKPVLGNNNLTLGSVISSITASASNYFQTNGTGKVISTLANNVSRLFPVGNTYYNGVTITNKTNASDQFSVLVKDAVLGNGNSGSEIITPHVKTTWDISKNNTNGGSGVDFNFNWNLSQEIGSISNFILNHHNGSAWEIAAGTSSAVSGTTTKSITQTGYTGTFSPFAFGPGVTPLPVELIKFQATCQSDYIQIKWATASEIRNKAFELYKSEDAQDWKLIHTTEGQGTKATETNYQFDDLDKIAGYYRFKDIDEDGIENWSSIIFADCKNETSRVQIYPNPATDYIKVIAPISKNTSLNIINLEGKVIKSMPLISNQTLVSVKDLAKGIYLIEINNQKQINQMKFLKK